MPEDNFDFKKSFKIIPNEKNPFDKFYQAPEPADIPQEIEEHEESGLEKVADELHVNLPQIPLPLGLKIIALLSLVGGLGTLGSAFSDIFSPQAFILKSYLLRLIGGILLIIIAYGIIKRQNWATWLYGAVVVSALFFNWPYAILPAAIVTYIYFNRKYFYKSWMDKFFNKMSDKVGSNLKS